MRKLLQLLGLVTVCFILSGCPMDTRFPIDHSRANYIDNNLLGSWKNRSDSKIYTLSQYDAYTYKMSFMYSDGTWGSYYPFMSFVNNQSFLCIPYFDEEMEENRYYLFSISTSNYTNTLQVRGLKQPYDFYPSTMAELRSWIVNNMNSSSFYSTDPDDIYILDRY